MAVPATPLYRRALLPQISRAAASSCASNSYSMLSARPLRRALLTSCYSRATWHDTRTPGAPVPWHAPQRQQQQKRFHFSQSQPAAHGHGHSHGILGFGGHDDDDGHDHDDDETNAMRTRVNEADVRAADRITWAGIYINVVLSGAKGVAGVAFNSAALLADAVHSMSDLVSDGITLVSLKYCARPPDQHQPYGYGKYETVGALSVSLLLVAGSLGIMSHSFETLSLLLAPAASLESQLAPLALEPEVVESIKAITAAPESFLQHAHAHATSGHAVAIHPAALGIAAVSVAAKEGLYRATIALGRKIHSSVLIANAWHHRSDAATSVVAMAGIGLSLAGLPMFDPLAGMLVGGIILKMGGEIGYSAIRELCDAQLPAPLVESLARAVDDVVQASNGDIVAVKQLRSRRIGRNVHVDLSLVMKTRSSNDGSDELALSFEDACVWKDRVKSAIRAQVPRVKDIIIELATPEQRPSTVFEDVSEQQQEQRATCAHDHHSHSHSHSHGHSHHAH